MDKTDYEIICDCISGNNDAFEELVIRYKKLIYSVVYNLIKDKEETNDISQEVFIRIYKALDRYNPEYKFSTWAVKIATNLCMDKFRKKRLETVNIEDEKRIVDKSKSPEEILLNKEKKRYIKEALDSLPPKYKLLIVLYHQKGMSYNEMVDILNKPMSIIKNRLFRARLMLRESLLEKREERIL